MASNTVHRDLDFVPIPFVAWAAVVEAEDPIRPATRGHYRTLKSNGRVSQGIRVHLRGATNVHGSETYHSVLIMLAFQAEHDGDHETASKLRNAARRLEIEFGSRVAAYLTGHSLAQLRHADFYTSLLLSMTHELQSTAWESHVFARGIVSEIDGPWAQIISETSLGERAALELRKELLDSWQLAPGDTVLVFQRHLHTAILTELLPGVNGGRQDDSTADFEASLWPKRDRRERERLLELAARGDIPIRTVRLTA